MDLYSQEDFEKLCKDTEQRKKKVTGGRNRNK